MKPELQELQRRSRAYDRLCSWLDSSTRIDQSLLDEIETILGRPLPAPPPDYLLTPPDPQERPIIFSASSVLAVRSDQQTQTRRPVKPQPVELFPFLDKNGRPTGDFGWCPHENVVSRHARCPYGLPGDRLWVRETWGCSHSEQVNGCSCWYYASGTPPFETGPLFTKRPAIYMPRWASRTTLEITGVRVERLADISEEDAKAEGFSSVEPEQWHEGLKPMLDGTFVRQQYRGLPPATWKQVAPCARAFDEHGAPIVDTYDPQAHSAVSEFQFAWNRLYSGRGLAWDVNPWVWVITFRQLPKEPL